MSESASQAATVAVRLDYVDAPGAIPEIAAKVASSGGTLRTLSTVRRWTDPGGIPLVEIELEVEGLSESDATTLLSQLPSLRGCRVTQSLDKVFGKRLIVIGGGAQIAQAVLGAVSEADRHNLRGEKISVEAQVTDGRLSERYLALRDGKWIELATSTTGQDGKYAVRALPDGENYFVRAAADNFGLPVSTTHTITGSIVGVGTAKRMKAVKWAVALRIIYAWVFTLPVAALLSACIARTVLFIVK